MSRRIDRERRPARIARLSVALAVAAVCGFAAPGARDARAHGVVVDGVATEWFGHTAPNVDMGRVARNADSRGEFVWRDAVADALPEMAGPGRDLQKLSVTCSPAGISVLAVLSPGAPRSGAGAPQLQLAIDTNHFFGLGAPSFEYGADLWLAPQAAWEALVVTRFGSGQGPIAFTANNTVTDGLEAVLAPDGTLEMFLPWKAVGLVDPPVGSLRVSAALFVSTAADSTVEVGDENTSDAVDVMTNYGDPGATANTLGETADLSLDYYADVWVDGRGEVRSPLVITEFDPGAGSHASWFELANVTQGVISIAGWKLGDSAVPDTGEAMGRFPGARLLGTNELCIVAADGLVFRTRFGFSADVECATADAMTPDLVAYEGWSPSPIIDIGSAGDEVLLLDPSNTAQDVVVYKNGSYPGVGAFPSIASGHSLERTSPIRDTDDCFADFLNISQPTPGMLPPLLQAPPPGRPSRLALRGLWPQPSDGEVFLDLWQPEAGPLRAAVYDMAGRRVAELRDGKPDAFEHVLRWDGRRADGRRASAGVYLVHVQGASGSVTARIVRVD